MPEQRGVIKTVHPSDQLYELTWSKAQPLQLSRNIAPFGRRNQSDRQNAFLQSAICNSQPREQIAWRVTTMVSDCGVGE
eukprot:3836261-Pyramimonas_sp.AAC.1